MYRKLLVAGGLTASLVGPAQAESFGLLNGRVAPPAMTAGDAAIELGYITGGLDKDEDYTHIGGRLNYQFSPVVTVFADYGQPEVEPDPDFYTLNGQAPSFDGNALGGGLYYYLPDQTTVASADVALKFSYHKADLEQDAGGATFKADYTFINAEVLFSGKEPVTESGALWYASVGVENLDVDYDFELDGGVGFAAENIDSSGTRLAAGGGLVLPVSNGMLYGGARLFVELTYGVGFRYFF